MKKLIYLLTVVIAFSSCKKDKDEDSIIGTWTLEKFYGVYSDGDSYNDVISRKTYLQFFETGEIYLVQLSENGQVNTVYTEGSYTKEGNTILFQNMELSPSSHKIEFEGKDKVTLRFSDEWTESGNIELLRSSRDLKKDKADFDDRY